MKKLISIICGTSLAIGAMATGNEGVNPTQSGTQAFDASTTLAKTITFPFTYSSLPAVQVYSLNGTNNAPYTVSAVTITNFVLTCNNGATTNGLASWTAYGGYPREYYGTNAMGAATLATNTFAVPFVLPPNVIVGNTITNGQAAATTITTSNFVITVSQAETVNWRVFGISYLPGITPVTY